MRIRKLFTFPIDDDLHEGLRRIEARDGVSKSEQVRRAIRLWLKTKGARRLTHQHCTEHTCHHHNPTP